MSGRRRAAEQHRRVEPGRQNESGAADHEDDPFADYPAWSKTLLLLLDYAIIEAVGHGLEAFVRILEMARMELEAHVAASHKTGPANHH